MFNDAQYISIHQEAYDKQVLQYVEKNKDNMLARCVLETRKVDESVSIDIVETFSRDTEGGAIIASKGTIPIGSAAKATDVPHALLQILDGFNLHERDLKADPKLKTRNINLVMDNIHRREDLLAIDGHALTNTPGIKTVGLANPNGKIVAAGAAGNDVDNNGAWNGSDPTRDIHQDVLNAIERLEGRFSPAYLVGHRNDLLNLMALDSQRQPFAHTIGPLFGKMPGDSSWIFYNDQFTKGKVYLIPKNMNAIELVVSENPKPDILPKQRGGVWPTEIREWVVPEFHYDTAVVELEVS